MPTKWGLQNSDWKLRSFLLGHSKDWMMTNDGWLSCLFQWRNLWLFAHEAVCLNPQTRVPTSVINRPRHRWTRTDGARIKRSPDRCMDTHLWRRFHAPLWETHCLYAAALMERTYGGLQQKKRCQGKAKLHPLFPCQKNIIINYRATYWAKQWPHCEPRPLGEPWHSLSQFRSCEKAQGRSLSFAVDVRTRHKNTPDVFDKHFVQIFGQMGNKSHSASSSGFGTELQGWEEGDTAARKRGGRRRRVTTQE